MIAKSGETYSSSFQCIYFGFYRCFYMSVNSIFLGLFFLTLNCKVNIYFLFYYFLFFENLHELVPCPSDESGISIDLAAK